MQYVPLKSKLLHCRMMAPTGMHDFLVFYTYTLVAETGLMPGLLTPRSFLLLFAIVLGQLCFLYIASKNCCLSTDQFNAHLSMCRSLLSHEQKMP